MVKHIVAGIVAHVDAGKTTLSEALLYRSGGVRKLGRVDHGDAFLDTETLEKQRGITIHAHQARVTTDGLELTLLDTPGHVDFAAETERVLSVLDYAIVVVSGVDGIQGHTETLWRLLGRYHVPTFVFVNKCDADGFDRDAVLAQLRRRLSDAAFAFGPAGPSQDELEDIATLDEAAADEYLSEGKISTGRLQAMIADRTLFPVYFGSALKLDGIDEFMAGLETYAREPLWPADFGARVYKVSHDAQHNRLTWLKVTGGSLKAKSTLDGSDGQEKADQVRVYNGAKFDIEQEIPAGGICAVTGPTRTFPGQGLGAEPDAGAPSLQPVLTYTVLPGGADDGEGASVPSGAPTQETPRFDDLTLHKVLAALRELEDEEPLLHVAWVSRLGEIHVQLMGAVQLEIIQSTLHERFGLEVSFGPGGILYRETITAPIEGVGHFEPLRHYAEAHILLEPGEPGSGVVTASALSENELDRNWQRLIMTHMREKEHLGTLIGAPLTDIKMTLVAGKAHLKHTEGGDFRQATYRAIRQGLMEARAGVVGRPSAEQIEAGRPEGTEKDGAFGKDSGESSVSKNDSSNTTNAKHGIASSAAKSGTKTGDADAADISSDAAAEAVPDFGPGNCRVLEPWYAFRLEVPSEMLGRAMSDIQRMAGTFEPPLDDGDYATLTGECPVSEMRDYAMDVNAYTHGRGRLSVTFAGYRPCHDEERVIAEAAYAPESDLENTPDSVFCAHGAGYPVKWYRVPAFMHLAWGARG